MEYFNTGAIMPPFPPPISTQYPYTTPLIQCLFPPPQVPMHAAHCSHSLTPSPSPYAGLPPPGFGFERHLAGPLALSINHQGTPADSTSSPPNLNASSRDDSIIALTLVPLTCPKSTIHIIVHDNDKTQSFPIHRTLLCFYSPYFRALLTKRSQTKTVPTKIKKKNYGREWRWEDSTTVDETISCSAGGEEEMDIDVIISFPASSVQEIVLDTESLGDVGRTVFAAFVKWLYRGYAGFGLEHPLEELPDAEKFDPVTLIQLWVFAGKVGVRECQNACVEGIEWWRMKTNVIQTSMLGWVYEHTEDWDGSVVDVAEPNGVVLEPSQTLNDTKDDIPPTLKSSTVIKTSPKLSPASKPSLKNVQTAQDCPLRHLLIDQCAWKLDGNWLLGSMADRKNEEQFPRQALVDLVSRMRVVLNERVMPPFENSLARRAAYWRVVEAQSVADVLEVDAAGEGLGITT